MFFLKKIKMFFRNLFVKQKQIEEKSGTKKVTMDSIQNYIQKNKEKEYQDNVNKIDVSASSGDGLGIQGPIQE